MAMTRLVTAAKFILKAERHFFELRFGLFRKQIRLFENLTLLVGPCCLVGSNQQALDLSRAKHPQCRKPICVSLPPQGTETRL